jgi:hypothetical protein
MARYVSQANYNNDASHFARAAFATRADPGAAQLNNFMNTGAAQNAAEHFGNTQAETNNYHAQLSDARAMAQVAHEQGLQNDAMKVRAMDVAGRNAAEMAKANSRGGGVTIMGGGGLLSGLTTSAPQQPAVNLYGSSGRRIGGTPLDGLA